MKLFNNFQNFLNFKNTFVFKIILKNLFSSLLKTIFKF